MKKTNFFKMVMTLVMAFMVTGAFAQWIPSTTQPTDTVTLGKNVPYFVEPDAYFSPAWTGGATGPDSGNATTTFNWSVPTVPVGGTATPTDVTANDNYIEYAFTGATGAYQIQVTETANSCAGSAVTQDVEVINAPDFAINTAAGYISADITACEGDAALGDIVGVTLSTDIAQNPSFQLGWQLEIKTLTSGGADDQFYDEGNLATAPVSGVPVAIDSTFTSGTQETGINTTTFDLTKPADGFIAIDDGGKQTTVYTYTVNGVNDRISRKSNYLTNSIADPTAWDVYGTAATIVITVNPAPVTGPIYHISNMWAN